MAFNHKSTAHLDQYAEITLLFADNTAAVDSNTAFEARSVLWGDSMTDSYNYRDQANASTKGFTKAKNAAKKVSSQSAASITGKAVSYAITKGNIKLEEEMNALTQSALYNKKDEDYAGVIQNIYTDLSAFVASDPLGTAAYFTALQLTSMQNDKITYTLSLGQYAKAYSNINKAKGNFPNLQIPIMEAHIKFFNGFMPDLSITYPDFVTLFKMIVEKIDTIGKRNQGVGAIMTYAIDGKVINSVGCLRITNYPAVKIPKIIFTNTMGSIPLLQLKIGAWDGVFSAPDCVDQPVTIIVKAKKITFFNIAMVAGTTVKAAPVATVAEVKKEVVEVPEVKPVITPEVPPAV